MSHNASMISHQTLMLAMHMVSEQYQCNL